MTKRQERPTDAQAPGKTLPSRRGLLLGGLPLLSGCVSLMPAKETKLAVRVRTDADINPSPTGIPSPLQLRIYILRSDASFLQSDAQSLYTKDAAVLGADLLSKRELVVAPSSQDGFTLTMPPEAAALGIVAGFREFDIAHWRVTAPITIDVLNTAFISVSQRAIKIDMQTETKSWPF